MYRLAVCEDELHVREELCMLCEEILNEMDISCRITSFSSAEELESAMLCGERFDLLCLDIYMKNKNGMTAAREIRRKNDKVSILFITNSRDYLKEGYEVRPIQYLYKPVDRKELEEALRADIKLRSIPRVFSLKLRNKTVILTISDICFVESRNHTVVVHLKDETEDQVFPISLSQIEERLPKDLFCRCHNSFLVNMQYISEISRKEIILSDGIALPVGRSYSKNMQNRFVNYLNRM